MTTIRVRLVRLTGTALMLGLFAAGALTLTTFAAHDAAPSGTASVALCMRSCP